jgi:hypothetical protein
MVTGENSAMFAGKPEAVKAFEQVMAVVRPLGNFVVEEKKTCLHITAGGPAFLGVHPRKNGLRLTVVLTRPIEGTRIVKCDKASANRYYIDLNLVAADGMDEELKDWIGEAYARALSSKP